MYESDRKSNLLVAGLHYSCCIPNEIHRVCDRGSHKDWVKEGVQRNAKQAAKNGQNDDVWPSLYRNPTTSAPQTQMSFLAENQHNSLHQFWRHCLPDTCFSVVLINSCLECLTCGEASSLFLVTHRLAMMLGFLLYLVLAFTCPQLWWG